MRNSFIFCICFLFFCSCEHKSSAPLQKTGAAPYVISLDKVIEDNEFSFKNFNGNFRYVQLETSSESLLTDILFLGLLNDTIVVVDYAHQIMSFTNSGKYIGRIGKEGGDSNEYNGVKSCSFDRKSGHVIVVDYKRILRYDLKGNLITTYSISDEFLKAYEDNSLFSNNYIFNYYRASTRESYAHSYFGINDSLKSGFINPNPMYKCAASIWSTHPLTQLDDTISFVKPLSDIIFQFTNGNIAPRFVIRHKEPSLPQEKIDFYNNSEKELNYQDYLSEQQNNGYFVGIQNIFETKDFLIFSLNYGANYIFDKSNRLLYKITGFKDLESNNVFFLKENSTRNSLIATISPFNAMTKQGVLQKEEDAKEQERLKNSPSEYERLILDFEEENNPIVIIVTFGE